MFSKLFCQDGHDLDYKEKLALEFPDFFAALQENQSSNPDWHSLYEDVVTSAYPTLSPIQRSIFQLAKLNLLDALKFHADSLDLALMFEIQDTSCSAMRHYFGRTYAYCDKQNNIMPRLGFTLVEWARKKESQGLLNFIFKRTQTILRGYSQSDLLKYQILCLQPLANLRDLLRQEPSLTALIVEAARADHIDAFKEIFSLKNVAEDAALISEIFKVALVSESVKVVSTLFSDPEMQPYAHKAITDFSDHLMPVIVRCPDALQYYGKEIFKALLSRYNPDAPFDTGSFSLIQLFKSPIFLTYHGEEATKDCLNMRLAMIQKELNRFHPKTSHQRIAWIFSLKGQSNGDNEAFKRCLDHCKNSVLKEPSSFYNELRLWRIMGYDTKQSKLEAIELVRQLVQGLCSEEMLTPYSLTIKSMPMLEAVYEGWKSNPTCHVISAAQAIAV